MCKCEQTMVSGAKSLKPRQNMVIEIYKQNKNILILNLEFLIQNFSAQNCRTNNLRE